MMEALKQQNIEKAISFLDEVKNNLVKTIDDKWKILQIQKENIDFIKEAFNLSESDIKDIIKVILNLRIQDIILKYKNNYTIIKYDVNKLNSRFAWFWDEKDVNNLLNIFKTAYDPNKIFNLVNSKFTISNKSNKEVERFINNQYRSFLFNKYFENIKLKLKDLLWEEDSNLDKLAKTIAGKILRDNFDKHTEKIANELFEEIYKNLEKNLSKILQEANNQTINKINLLSNEWLKDIQLNLYKIWKDAFIKNLNKIIFIPYYWITIQDEQVLTQLTKVIFNNPKIKSIIISWRKELKRKLAFEIINVIKNNKSNKELLKMYENFLSFYAWNQIRKWSKKITFPKININFLDMDLDISQYNNPWKVLISQILRLTNQDNKYTKDKLKLFINSLANIIWHLPKIEKL